MCCIRLFDRIWNGYGRMEIDMNTIDFDALEQDADFRDIERFLPGFNIFSAMGAGFHEIRHSNFLAFLLRPGESHDLGPAFFVELIGRVFQIHGADDLTKERVSDKSLFDWSSLRVYREYHNIDLLLVDAVHGFVCCIENKIKAGEHGDQLSRYEKVVDKKFPVGRFPHRLFLFLTPEGHVASRGVFLPLSYRVVHEALLALEQQGSMKPEVAFSIKQYGELLKMHILKQEELIRRCQEIYQRHKAVFDAVYEHGEIDSRQLLRDHLLVLLKTSGASSDLVEDHSTGAILRFYDATLDSKKWMKNASGWTESNRILLYEFTIKPNELWIELVVGQGKEALRKKIIDSCNGSRIFSPPRMKNGKYAQYPRLWSHKILDSDDYKKIVVDWDPQPVLQKLNNYWNKFLREKLPGIRGEISKIG